MQIMSFLAVQLYCFVVNCAVLMQIVLFFASYVVFVLREGVIRDFFL